MTGAEARELRTVAEAVRAAATRLRKAGEDGPVADGLVSWATRLDAGAGGWRRGLRVAAELGRHEEEER